MRYIRIHPKDNVAVALQDLAAGEMIEGVRLLEAVPRGHKVLLADLSAGDAIVKYGYTAGHVTCDKASGALVDHNCLRTNLEGLQEYSYEPEAVSEAAASAVIRPLSARSSFKGFRRADGQVGIRNQIWIIPTVGCVNGVCQEITERFRQEIAGQAGSVDAIVCFPHNYGCSQLGDDHENTRSILADMVRHPNAGGVLVVSLGCENNQLDAFRELVGPVDGSRVKMFITQKVEDEVEYGLQQLREIYAVASKDSREDIPLSELKVGLKCGGSDGLSGITANPLLGVFSDWLVASGGSVVLTEVPEMFGAETILMNRCCSKEVFEKTVRLINDFKDYFIRQGMPVYENPSPGNKAGGISTLEEKSLGCTQKCGTSAVRDVLGYGERLSVKGLNLLSAPGNDLVASTALAAAGCQLILFTTGRGTPFGSFVPTMKVSTNSSLAQSKPHWIDFNAGTLAEDEPMETVAGRFADFVLDVASGALLQSEKHNYREISIFKQGVTL